MTSGKSNYKAVLKKVKAETPKRIDKGLQATVVDAATRMIDRTPVDTGAAKYHWFVRQSPFERFDKDHVDPSGQQPKQRAKRDAKLIHAGVTIWIVNSAPYFIFLENGSSKQASSGVVAITVAEMAFLYRKNMSIAFKIGLFERGEVA